ncbi:agmatine deiminase family protein [Nocardia colli]|uniref:agmatine deiminase family protein n=1 Tax=Nocardia colli TaxID=2545717 RepID=UPI0035D5F813
MNSRSHSRRAAFGLAAMFAASTAALSACASNTAEETKLPVIDRPAPPGPPPGSLDESELRPILAGYSMPGEWVPHERTIMAWPSSPEIWGMGRPGHPLLGAARREIAELAKTIARFEPVLLCAVPEQAADAQLMCGPSVEVAPIPVDDLWTRDSGPIFLNGPQGQIGLDFNFNTWGNKGTFYRDGRLARRTLERLGVRRVQAPMIAEGGGLEVDGAGTLLATESAVVNDNRNFGRSRAELEDLLRPLLGVRKFIWLKGLRGQDPTDGHIDLIARFVEPGVVVVNRPAAGAPADKWAPVWQEAIDVLRTSTDAAGRRLRVVDLIEADVRKLGDHGGYIRTGYVNYYVLNGAVIVPAFGDETADARALATLRDLHPGRAAVAVNIRNLAEGGGGIHCATMQQPKA